MTTGGARRPSERPAGRPRPGDDGGSVLVFTALTLTVMLMFTALAVDIGYSSFVKRALQRSADAAALAGVHDLDLGSETARAKALEYSGSAGNRNHAVDNTTTTVCVPGDTCGQADKVIVEESVTVDSFFGSLWSNSDWTIKARAVASRPSTTTTTVVQGDAKMAVFANNGCSDEGLLFQGDRMRIEDNIHSNGRFNVGNPGFDNSKAPARATVWRGTGQSGDCKDVGGIGEIVSGSKFTPPEGSTTPSTRPTTHPTRRYWPSGGPAGVPASDPYVEVSVGGQLLPRMAAPPSATAWDPTQRIKCTHTGTTITASSADGVYCASSKVTVDITGTTTKRITVIAPEVEIKNASRWRPHCLKDATYTPPSSACKSDSEPLLVYDRSPASQTVINTSSASQWSGYIINRTGSILVNNSGAMTSPLLGYLEATWVKINGADFWMQGSAPDPSDYEETTTTVWEGDWSLAE